MGGARCNCGDLQCPWEDDWLKKPRELTIEDMRKVLKTLLKEQEKTIEKCYWCETPRSYEEPCKQCGRP